MEVAGGEPPLALGLAPRFTIFPATVRRSAALPAAPFKVVERDLGKLPVLGFGHAREVADPV